MNPINALWAYRGFVGASVRRDFQAKYRNAVIGPLWALINPLAMIAVYTLIFTEVMQARLPQVGTRYAYSIFVCAGLLAWGLFAEICTRTQSAFVDNAGLLKKISFPRLCLPAIVVLNALINFAIIFGLFTLFLIFSGTFPGWVYLAVCPLVALLVTLAVGLGVSLGVLHVFFRDVGQILGIALQFWFWLTPVVYPLSVVPAEIGAAMAYNPMCPLITAFQTVILKQAWPDWSSLGYPLLVAIALCWIGLRLFRLNADEMLDAL
jgi:lipopolysaccharide transport system permease protein